MKRASPVLLCPYPQKKNGLHAPSRSLLASLPGDGPTSRPYRDEAVADGGAELGEIPWSVNCDYNNKNQQGSPSLCGVNCHGWYYFILLSKTLPICNRQTPRSFGNNSRPCSSNDELNCPPPARLTFRLQCPRLPS